MAFTITAGKYDGYDRNCKYCDDAETLDQAIIKLQSVSDYPWAQIEYTGVDNTKWIIDAYPANPALR